MVAEARIDAEMGRSLFDRVCVSERAWLDGQLDLHRTWKMELRWRDSPAPIGAFGFRFGRYDGLPRDEDAYALFKHAIRCQLEQVEVLLALRDGDGKATARRAALVNAMSDERFPKTVKVAVGIPDYERESWVLSGLEPSQEEAGRVDLERKRLGFDPLERPEELDAANDHDSRSVKRCLEAIIGIDPQRERCCWEETPLKTLEARGGGNGLRVFLREVAVIARALF